MPDKGYNDEDVPKALIVLTWLLVSALVVVSAVLGYLLHAGAPR